jgi:hypothetical protein
MITVNVLGMFSFTPLALKHAAVYGTWHLIDLGAPMFFFTIGLSIGLSFDRYRLVNGVVKTIVRYIRRGLIFIIIGTLGVLLMRHHPLHDWSVLQTIGGAGLMALPFMFLPARWRWLAGVVLIIIFQIIAVWGYADWLEKYDFGGLGGPLGGLAWGGVVLCGASLGSFLRDDWKRFIFWGLTMSVLALSSVTLLDHIQRIDKRLATAPYLALTIGLGTVLMIIFAYTERQWHLKMRLLGILGANSLIVFVLQGLGVIIGSRFIPPSTPFIAALLYLIFIYGLCVTVTALLYKKKIYFRL